jgi:thioesterase domain-containing protein/acyl carrier protein
MSVTDPIAVTTHKSKVTPQHTNELTPQHTNELTPQHTHEATAQQTSLLELLAKLLYLPAHEITEHVQLTDYGMDSMLSARLVQHLRLDFGVDLDLVTLATLQTYQQLAQFVGGQVAAQSGEQKDRSSNAIPEMLKLPTLYRRFPELIPLNRGEGRPVFWFHGGLGSVESYRTIAQQVSRPFYGIQARGFMTERQPLRGVEAMAAYYVQVILAVQPVGPYDLGGYSLGGTLAYEVTRQLQELGEHVQTIVMIDSYAVVDSAVNPLFEKRLMLGVVNMALQSNTEQPGAGLDRLLHRDELDLSQDDAAFWRQLLELAHSRGLTKNEEQLRAQLLQMSKFGHSLVADGFEVSALTQPEAVRGYYFKNASGSFYGALEPYFVVGALEACFADNAQYWEAWQKNIPLLEIVAVPASNHVSLLSDATSFVTITQHCRHLYLTG